MPISVNKNQFSLRRWLKQEASFARSTQINPTSQEQFGNLSSLLVVHYGGQAWLVSLPCQSLRGSTPLLGSVVEEN